MKENPIGLLIFAVLYFGAVYHTVRALHFEFLSI